jgi:hypothetical protein
VRPLAKDYASARRAFEQAQNRGVDSVDALIEAFVEATAGVLAVTSCCWHDTDPITGAPLSMAALGDPPGSFEEALDYEFRRPDVSTFSDLRGRRTPVASISAETRDRLSASVRFREMIAPRGAADELRVSFRDQFGTWAALVLFTARRMTP